MLKIGAVPCFVWQLQLFKNGQKFVLGLKCGHFGTQYFHYVIS